MGRWNEVLFGNVLGKASNSIFVKSGTIEVQRQRKRWMVVPAAIGEDNSSGLVEVERLYYGDVVTYVSFDNWMVRLVEGRQVGYSIRKSNVTPLFVL